MAAEAFADAMVAYEQGIAGLKDVGPLVDTLGQQGVVFALQGDRKSAQQAFERALALDPAWRLDAGAPSKAKASFETTARAQKSAGQGSLTVYASTGAAQTPRGTRYSTHSAVVRVRMTGSRMRAMALLSVAR